MITIKLKFFAQASNNRTVGKFALVKNIDFRIFNYISSFHAGINTQIVFTISSKHFLFPPITVKQH